MCDLIRFAPVLRTLLGVLMLSLALPTAGAVVRQILHLNDGPIVGWRCDGCGAGNAGDPQTSFHAVCRRCQHEYDWSRIAAVTGGSARPPVTIAR